MDAQDKAKEAAAKKAAFWVENKMTIGVGTGTTASYFIKYLIKRCKEEKLEIQAIPTSNQSLELIKGHIPLADMNHVFQIDMTIDGADEIDSKKRMIKGGGGALLREKIVASISREMVVIIDASKRVPQLGKFPFPVEIVPFAYASTLKRLEQMGYAPILRLKKNKEIFITDNQNYIADIHFKTPPENMEEENEKIRKLIGVVETGFFAHLAGRVITGFPDGNVEIQN